MKDNKFTEGCIVLSSVGSGWIYGDTHREEIFQDMAKISNVLCKYGYQLCVEEEEHNIVRIDYCYSPKLDFGTPVFMCVDEEEMDMIEGRRDDEHCKD